MQRSDVQQVADGVFRVRGGIVNWYLLRAGRELQTVDSTTHGGVPA